MANYLYQCNLLVEPNLFLKSSFFKKKFLTGLLPLLLNCSISHPIAFPIWFFFFHWFHPFHFAVILFIQCWTTLNWKYLIATWSFVAIFVSQCVKINEKVFFFYYSLPLLGDIFWILWFIIKSFIPSKFL